jgi:hypothetical protein
MLCSHSSFPSLVSAGVIKTNLGAHMGWRASAFYWLFGERVAGRLHRGVTFA